MDASYKPSHSASDVGRNAGHQMSGYIFMCSARTKPDCFAYRVFGLPASRVEIVEKIKPNMTLFLFDFDLRLLYGQYVADASGKLAIEPLAFGGLFPAQVKFSIVRDCLPLREVAFKDAIKENYYTTSKFKQELSSEQVSKLAALFRPIHIPLTLGRAMFDNARESLPSWYRGSSAQTARPPSSGLIHAHLHRSVSHFQEAPLRPFHAHNQVLSLRNGTLAPQFDPVPSHQAYHPDDPGLHQCDTHARNAFMHLSGSGAMSPQVTSANSYYGIAPMPQSNAFHAQSKAVAPSAPAPSSSLTASHWVAIAAGLSQSLGGQATAVIVPPSSELSAPYSSNAATVTQQYPNQGYHSSYQEQSVISNPNHSFPPPTLVSNSGGEVGVIVDQTYMNNSTNSSASASGYQYQGYSDPSYYQAQFASQTTASASGYQYQGYPEPSYYQAASQTTDQLVSNAPAHVPETHSAYWGNTPSDHLIEQYQITQATVVGAASEHPISGNTNVPVYSAGANPTY